MMGELLSCVFSLYGMSIILASLPVLISISKWYFNGPMCTSQTRLDGKVVIVTGANTGIGKETARDLAKRGARVILACRNYNKCNAAVLDIQNTTGVRAQHVYGIPLDLSSVKSVHRFVELLNKKENRLDILINNAGCIGNDFKLTEDGYELVLATNYLGPFLLTHLLMDKLKASQPSRVVNVASMAHKWGDINLEDLNRQNDYRYNEAYWQSKLGNILFTRQLAKELTSSGVSTYAVHPGVINTDFWRNYFLNFPPIRVYMDITSWPFVKDIIHGAQTTIYCAVDESVASESGKYYSDCKEAEPSELAQDDELAQKLWDKTMHLLKLH